MYLSQKTLEKLRFLINEDIEYRSGPKLVDFFNNLGFSDVYQNGFPSRWAYTDEKLKAINGKIELDQCIKNLFAPINFIGKMSSLDKYITEFNQYLEFDGWIIAKNGKEITFKKAEKIEALDKIDEIKSSEDEFLKIEFKDLPLKNIAIDSMALDVIEKRIEETKKCMQAKAALSTVFLCGSTLEGLLLGIAIKYPSKYNQSQLAPKDKEGKVKTLQNWTLANFIDVSCDLGYLKEDVKKFSHSLRDFRNYIHPYAQMSSHFDPDEHTAKICFQVLKTAIYQLAAIK